MASRKKNRAEIRCLRFESIEDLQREIERIEAAERAGALRRTGNWTTGQIFGHLASWIDYAYEGFPPGATPPWLVKVIAKMLKKSILTKPMRAGMRLGPRTPGGTYGTEVFSTEEGAARLRAALSRLQRGEPPKHYSPAFGPMTDDERIALNLRHAELHLGFLHPYWPSWDTATTDRRLLLYNLTSMVTNRRDILTAALALPEHDRAALIDQLLESLDPTHREAIDRAWADEAERRLQRLESGETKAIAGESVMQRLQRGQRP